MNIPFLSFDESLLDIEDLEAERDLHLAGVDAIRRARKFGTGYVIREDDQVKDIPPDKTGPYEEQLLAGAARLDRRIAELKSNSIEEAAAALKDSPAPKPPSKQH